MSTYAIGDIQGCYDSLVKLLDKIKFNPNQDTLWFAGDLVNRGPKSLETIRFIKQLGDSAIVVLGNHDLHLLALSINHPKFNSKQSSLQDIINAPDSDEIIYWLRHQKIMHSDDNIHMVHAGIYPHWSILQAQNNARKVESILQSDNYKELLLNIHGNYPDKWNDNITGYDELRFIINAFTRMRFIEDNGRLDFLEKGNIGEQDPGLIPWFEHPKNISKTTDTIIFGHWSQLEKIHNFNTIGTDTGCLWGKKLTAYQLNNQKIHHIGCPQYKGK